VHADAIGAANTDHPYAGTVAFGAKVLAIATSTADLQATTPAFGVPATTYSTSPDQGLEYNDAATLTTQDKVTMTFNVYNNRGRHPRHHPRSLTPPHHREGVLANALPVGCLQLSEHVVPDQQCGVPAAPQRRVSTGAPRVPTWQRGQRMTS
jgi:hypothetical protein